MAQFLVRAGEGRNPWLEEISIINGSQVVDDRFNGCVCAHSGEGFNALGYHILVCMTQQLLESTALTHPKSN